jgi:hypothetical protein
MAVGTWHIINQNFGIGSTTPAPGTPGTAASDKTTAVRG